jgi:hypothetical protein
VPDIVATVRQFTDRFPAARVDGVPNDLGPTIRESLPELDELLADQIITAEEHARQRDRILGEL